MDAQLTENLSKIKDKLPQNVNLVAISKTKPARDIMQAYQAGHRDFGENRIQEMADKYEELPKDIRWHMVGHVQGNKVKYMAPFVHLVHGIDKAKRVKELNKEAAKVKRTIGCLLQIHIAEEESKFGFSFQEAWDFLSLPLNEKYPHVEIRGLMGMATFTDDKAKVRQEFKGLHNFFSRVQNELDLPGFKLLSMGMSGDYEIAIEEGSNMVRLGSIIFGERD